MTDSHLHPFIFRENKKIGRATKDEFFFFSSSLSSLCSPASSLLFTKLLFRVWLWSHEAVCAREMHLNLPIRVSQCYTHPDNPQFTISEIDQVQSLSNLTHGAEVRALCWTLLSTVPTTVWVGPEGIKRSLLFSLSPFSLSFLDLR